MKTILLADDEVHLRTLVHTTLEADDTRIIEAADGVEAIERARALRPDLVILDWMMPGLTGLDVAQVLRQTPTLENVPIIMLTAKSQEADVLRARAAGITDYLVKPFSPLELLDRVEAILGSLAVRVR